MERATANPRHPFCNFTTGTRKTLHVDPKSNKNLKYEVFNFFKRQYSANLMTVCIIHNADLQKIEEIAVGKFYSTWKLVLRILQICFTFFKNQRYLNVTEGGLSWINNWVTRKTFCDSKQEHPSNHLASSGLQEGSAGCEAADCSGSWGEIESGGISI